MCYISAKLFLILCEYILVCTCTQGLIKKLIFLICVPSIAKFSTIMHSFALFIQHNVFFLFLVINFFKTKKIFVFYISWICNQGWLYYFYITYLCTLFFLDELILLHFTSLSFVVHVVWELFIVFDHMILILKSHTFDCKD